MEILYPFRIDTVSPISTIYKEVGQRIDHSVTAFIGPNDESNYDSIRTIRLSNRDWQKAIDYSKHLMQDYDLIHTGPANHNILSLLSRYRYDTKIVHTIHNAEKLHNSASIKIAMRRKIMSDQSDTVTTVSEYIAREIIPSNTHNNVVIPNGVDLELFNPKESVTNTNLVLYIGRLVNRKNPQLVIELAELMPEKQFTVRGDGDPELVEKFERIENINIVSKMAIQDLVKLYSEAAVTICPFEREGFGMVLVESMACGTPVIGLKDGNITNLINEGKNGEFCETLDPKEWQSQLEKVVNESECYAPRDSVKEYNWEKVSTQYERVYDSLV